MKPFSDREKRQVVQQVRSRFDRIFTPLDFPPGNACLILAALTADSINSSGRARCIMQAGTMMWRCVAEADDDGVSPTHFGYLCPSQGGVSLAPDMLSECHCWAAIPALGELIDLSTRHLPEQAALHCVAWRTESPPDHVWGQPPEAAEYLVEQAECLRAVDLMRRLLDDFRLPQLRMY
jgi:hypothetical protein